MFRGFLKDTHFSYRIIIFKSKSSINKRQEFCLLFHIETHFISEKYANCTADMVPVLFRASFVVREHDIWVSLDL